MTISTTAISVELEAYLTSISAHKDLDLLRTFESADQFGMKAMQISWLQANFLQLILSLVNPASVLEIGTFVGFSASVIAKAIPAESRVITCEHISSYYDQAVANFSRSGLADKVEPIFGDAKKTVVSSKVQAAMFDLIFLDGDKANYAFYFDALREKLRPGGLFIADNILFKGEVIMRSKSAHATGIARLNDLFAGAEDFQISHLTIGDGMLIARKLPNK